MKSLALLITACIILSNALGQVSYKEEFNGPFKSWANAKTRFRATGNGVTDDTKALQTALDSLTSNLKLDFNRQAATRYVVIYLPAGIYKISETLHLTGKVGVSFIGEDPLKTIIKWAGGDNDTMFHANRSPYIKISRITWDGNNKNNIEALGIHYKDLLAPNYSPTSIELSDMIFKGNLQTGIAGGTYVPEGTGMMDAEVTIKRCKFYSCRGAGISIKGYNALDYWVWDCEFNDCQVGVDCKHGNYHIYNSQFKNSQKDIQNLAVYYSSVRGCYSENANVFSFDEGASCGPFKRIFQGNTVIDCKSIPIEYHHQGKITLLDNSFIQNKIKQTHVLNYTSWCKGSFDVLSVQNNYVDLNAFNMTTSPRYNIRTIADKKIDVKLAKLPAKPSLQPFLPLVARKIFEVKPGATTATIQEVINRAAALKGEQAIVHFPIGIYVLDKSLIIPAGSDCKLIGDGLLESTVFKKAPGTSNDFKYFIIQGPSYCTIQDIQIGNDGDHDNANAFSFSNVDQAGSQVHIDQIYSSSKLTLNIDQNDFTYFEKNNSFFSKGTHIVGGSKVKAGTGTSRLYCFGGQSAGVFLENNATMVAKDCWWEGNLKKDFLPLDLSGSGNLTIDGAMYAPTDQDSATTIRINNFTGNVSLMDMYLSGSIMVNPTSPNLKLLVWNVNMYHKKEPLLFLNQKTSSQIAMLGITSQCFKNADSTCIDENPRSVADGTRNINDLTAFIMALIKDNRKAMPKPFAKLPVGTSNIYISRVCTYNGNTAYTFKK